MEALAAFGINWKLLVIQMVNFGLLMALLYRFAYKPVLAMLEKREATISESVANAEEVAKERAHISQEREGVLAEARHEATDMVLESRRHAEERAKDIIHSAEERSDAIVVEAKKKSEAEREHILRESEKDIAKIAILAAEKILRKESA